MSGGQLILFLKADGSPTDRVVVESLIRQDGMISTENVVMSLVTIDQVRDGQGVCKRTAEGSVVQLCGSVSRRVLVLET